MGSRVSPMTACKATSGGHTPLLMAQTKLHQPTQHVDEERAIKKCVKCDLVVKCGLVVCSLGLSWACAKP